MPLPYIEIHSPNHVSQMKELEEYPLSVANIFCTFNTYSAFSLFMFMDICIQAALPSSTEVLPTLFLLCYCHKSGLIQ